MAIITPPARLPLRAVKWRLQEPAQINRSGWTGTSKVVGLPGAGFWTVTGTFVVQIGVDRAKKWRAFFAALRGSRNTFPMIATEETQAPGVFPFAGGPAGPLNAGATLPLYNLNAGQLSLRAGDLLGVPLPSGHRRLVVVTEDVYANGSAQAVAHVAPELGETPASGTFLYTQEPQALMRLTSEPPGWDVDVGQTYTFTLSAEEAR